MSEKKVYTPSKTIAIGTRFGRLVTINHPAKPSKSNNFYVATRCDCGTEKRVRTNHLFSGATQSCGCYRNDQIRKALTSHGKTGTPLYIVWGSMLKRCTNPKCKAYPNYGGRGISVSKEWSNFENFYRFAIESGWKPGLEIDRIDNDGNYEPSNVRFVPRVINSNNTRRNHNLTAFGEVKSMSLWARDPRCVVCYKCLQRRISRGWPPERSITTPNRNA